MTQDDDADKPCDFCGATSKERFAIFVKSDKTVAICDECVEKFHDHFEQIGFLMSLDQAQMTKQ